MTIDGVTVVITRSSGLPFDLVDNTSAGQTGKPPTWGGVSLDPFFAPTAGDYFIATFSHYVSGVSIDFGDYGGDTDHAFLSAFSGMGATGAFLGGDAALWTGTFPSFGFLTYTQLTPGIRSIAFGNLPGDDFVPSLFFDNLSLRGVAIPGPAAALVFGVGLLGRRRRRS
ncbi:MAG TPA: hypothetical protein VM328_02495 [Fimbriimonadaceae bacterium]|nr:hypothetical protein [Fimbriimonadaceae bacterium]